MTSYLTKLMSVLMLASTFNAHALLVKLDFSTFGSTDLWGNVTNAFDVTQAGFTSGDFSSITQSILSAVREDYYSTSYAFINTNQQLDIDFLIATVADDVSGIDADNYTFQIGTGVSGPDTGYLGIACSGCVSSSGATTNSVVGSIFSNTIFTVLGAAVGGLWDLTEVINAIAGTLSHEIGHTLGLSHPSGAQSNPGESAYALMATGASPSNMPNSERLVNRAFSDANMQILVDNIGLRTTASVSAPSVFALFTFGLIGIFIRRTR